MRLAVHSWLLQVGGKKILIDSCCGNNKAKPGRPFWHMLNLPYLERLAAAGVRPDEIDLVMCTHLHHDHVGWNTQQKDGKWVPTFPNARYVFSQPDVEYFSKDRCRSEGRTGGTRHLSRMRRTDSRVRQSRSRQWRSLPAQRIPRNRFQRLVIHPDTYSSSSRARASAPPSSGTSGITCCRSIIPTGISRRTRMPAQARVSRRKVLDYCASSGALVFPGHVGLPFAGHIEKTQKGYRPDFPA